MEATYKNSKRSNKQWRNRSRQRLSTVQDEDAITAAVPPWPTISHPRVSDARRAKVPESDDPGSKYLKKISIIESAKQNHKNAIEIKRKLELITRRVQHSLEAGGFEPDLPEANLEDLELLPMEFVASATSIDDTGLERKRYFKDLLNTITETSLLRDGLLQEALMWLDESTKKNLDTLAGPPSFVQLQNSGETILEALSRTNVAIQQLSLLTVKIIGFDKNEDSLHKSMLDAFRLCSDETKKRLRQAMRMAESKEAQMIEHDLVEMIQTDCEDEKVYRNILQEISENHDQLKDICNTIQVLWITMADNPMLSNTRRNTLKRSIFLFNLVVMILTKRNRDLLLCKAEMKQRELDLHSTQSRISRLSSDLLGFHERYDDLYKNTVSNASPQPESLADNDDGRFEIKKKMERNVEYRRKLKAVVNQQLQMGRLERQEDKLRKLLKYEDYYDLNDPVYSRCSLNVSTTDIVGIRGFDEDTGRRIPAPYPQKNMPKKSYPREVASQREVATQVEASTLDGGSGHKTDAAASSNKKVIVRNEELSTKLKANRKSIGSKLPNYQDVSTVRKVHIEKNAQKEQLEKDPHEVLRKYRDEKTKVQVLEEDSKEEHATSEDGSSIANIISSSSASSSNNVQKSTKDTRERDRKLQDSLKKLYKIQSEQTEKMVTDFKGGLEEILEEAGFTEQSHMLSELQLTSSKTQGIFGENIDLLSSMQEQNIRLRGVLDSFLGSIYSSIHPKTKPRRRNVGFQTCNKITRSPSATNTLQKNEELKNQLQILRSKLAQIKHEKEALTLSNTMMQNLIVSNQEKDRVKEEQSIVELGDGKNLNSQLVLSKKSSHNDLLREGESVASFKAKLNKAYSSVPVKIDSMRLTEQAWATLSSPTLPTNKISVVQSGELSRVKLFRCVSQSFLQLQENLSDRTIPVYGIDKTLFEDTMDVREKYQKLIEEAIQDLCKRFVPLMRLKSLTRTTGNIIVKYRDMLAKIDHSSGRSSSSVKIARKLSRAESTYWKIQKRRDELVNNASNKKESKNEKWTSLLVLRKRMIHNFMELQAQVQQRIFKGREIASDDIKKLPPFLSEMIFLCEKITADMLDEKVDGQEDIQIEDEEEDPYLSSDDFTNEEQSDQKCETYQPQICTSTTEHAPIVLFSKVNIEPRQSSVKSLSTPVMRHVSKSNSSVEATIEDIPDEPNKHEVVEYTKSEHNFISLAQPITTPTLAQQTSHGTETKFVNNKALESNHMRTRSALGLLEFVEPVSEERGSPFRKSFHAHRPQTARAHTSGNTSRNSNTSATRSKNAHMEWKRTISKIEPREFEKTWKPMKSYASYEEIPKLKIGASELLGGVNLPVWAEVNLDARQVRKRLQKQMFVSRPQHGRSFLPEQRRLREAAWVKNPRILTASTLSKPMKAHPSYHHYPE